MHYFMAKLRYTPEILDTIKSRVSIRDVIAKSAVSGMVRKGRDWWCCCPFHHEKTPSFHIHDDRGYYHCFGCGAHGNAFNYVQETRGGSFMDAVLYLSELTGVELEMVDTNPKKEAARKVGFEALNLAETHFVKNLKGSAKEYVDGRGLTEDIIKEFGIGYSANEWRDMSDTLSQQGISAEALTETGLTSHSEKSKSNYDRFRGRLMFPIHNMENKTVGFGGRVMGDDEGPKYLNSPETPFFNKRYVLYNLNRARDFIRQQKQALVVEGYMDVIGLWQHGIKTAIAPLGTAITEDQIKLLWRFNEAPIICLDGDRAGRGAAVRVAHRVLSVIEPGKTLKFAWMPDGEDPDSFVSAQGKEAFYNLIRKTATLEDVLWQDITAETDITSGDGRAAVESAIDDVSKMIKNETVRRHYTRSLKDRLWSGGRKKHNNINMMDNKKKVSFPSGQEQARILLSILFRKPELFNDFYEKMSQVQVDDVRLKEFQKILFKLFEDKGLEKDNLDTYLVNIDRFDDVSAWFDMTEIHQTDDDGLKELWENAHKELVNPDDPRKQRKMASSVFDDNAWEQMKLLHSK
jgi:DNA primase